MNRNVLELLNYCFPDYKEENRFEVKYEPNNIHCLDEDSLKGVVVKKKYLMNMNGSIIQANALSGLAIHPTERNKGYGRTLISKMLHLAYDDGDLISVLDPFLHSYYRRLGFEDVYEYFFYDMSIRTLDNIDCDAEYIRCEYTDLSVLRDSFYRQYNGTFIVPFSDAKKAFLMSQSNMYACKVCVDDSCGYILYEFNESYLIVHEAVWESVNVYKGILKYIHNHSSSHTRFKMRSPVDDPLRHLMHEPNDSIQIKSDMMARVINAEKILELFQVNKEVVIRIKDDILSHNNDVFELGPIGVRRSKRKEMLTLDIGELTLLVCGQLDKVLLTKDLITRTLIRSIFSSSVTYMNERF